MSTEHIALGCAAAIFLGALVYAVRSRAGFKSVASFLPAIQAVEPQAADLLVKLVKQIDADGLAEAARRQVDKMAGAAADQHALKMSAAVAPKDPA